MRRIWRGSIWPRARLDLFKSLRYIRFVNPDSIRTSVDLPRDLHRRLHEAAVRKGCSARQLILRGIERAVEESTPKRPSRRLNLDKPIVPSTGKPFDLTNEQIYDLSRMRRWRSSYV
jgi:hypothetical protein